MKKLFALLAVSGMMFFSCTNKPAEPAVGQETTEQKTTDAAAAQQQQNDAAQTQTPEQTPPAQQ